MTFLHPFLRATEEPISRSEDFKEYSAGKMCTLSEFLYCGLFLLVVSGFALSWEVMFWHRLPYPSSDEQVLLF